MKEIEGDIWEYYDQGHWIVITTNGTVRRDGHAVMGAGVAAQAKSRIRGLSRLLGDQIQIHGNHVYGWYPDHIITFPVKHQFWEKADMALIQQSAKELKILVEKMRTPPGTMKHQDLQDNACVYLVRPGAGYGWLEWTDVKPVISKHLDDRFVVVERPQPKQEP